MKPYDVFVGETDLKIKELFILLTDDSHYSHAALNYFLFVPVKKENDTGSVLLLLIKTKTSKNHFINLKLK